MIRVLVVTALLCLAVSTNIFAQTSNASVGGFVQDPSGAFIPGVSVTATNTQTGVATTAVTNESGAYNITSLLPGIYKLSAELPGFRTRVFNDVQLGASNAAQRSRAIASRAGTARNGADQSRLYGDSFPDRRARRT